MAHPPLRIGLCTIALCAGAGLCGVGGLLGGCASTPDEPAGTESNLTPGMAKRTIRIGETMQATVLEVFGPPDLVTHRDDQQIWTYDKVSHEIETSSSYFTVIIAGASSSKSRSSSTSSMLILYFDAADIVRDYRMNVVRY